ncbi:Hypothetical predicted protein [Olea europaea subsp. europaea]|uniref:Uncharacterized protein n=1 Tax=Olea europaea subsp. europaea TaxID=158383 RepID=A0A8S0QSX6_OLEEU|nr:Hypothetical predicted protein [Olea europaea subsp. europaea]
MCRILMFRLMEIHYRIHKTDLSYSLDGSSHCDTADHTNIEIGLSNIVRWEIGARSSDSGWRLRLFRSARSVGDSLLRVMTLLGQRTTIRLCTTTARPLTKLHRYLNPSHQLTTIACYHSHTPDRSRSHHSVDSITSRRCCCAAASIHYLHLRRLHHPPHRYCQSYSQHHIARLPRSTVPDSPLSRHCRSHTPDWSRPRYSVNRAKLWWCMRLELRERERENGIGDEFVEVD